VYVRGGRAGLCGSERDIDQGACFQPPGLAAYVMADLLVSEGEAHSQGRPSEEGGALLLAVACSRF
jgi:hypothetical protein